jgi:threonine dehydrogenase-like Zn-dependent dehydrogenase
MRTIPYRREDVNCALPIISGTSSPRTSALATAMKELNVQYVLGYTPDEFANALRLIAEGKIDAASLVTAAVGIDGVAAAFADLANPERHTKIIVEPWR